MPFDEDDVVGDKDLSTSLKQVSTQPSMFNSKFKKSKPEEFNEKVLKHQEDHNNYKLQAAQLACQFNKLLSNKTLKQNKNLFSKELEIELLTNMIQLAIEVNNDPNEQEGMGSLSWITLLLKTALSQRDRLNELEFELHQLKNNLSCK
jgi:hypothetical protein